MTTSVDQALIVRSAVPVVLLVLFGCWETIRPFFGDRPSFGPAERRWPHAGRNLGLAVGNAIVLRMALVAITAATAEWTGRNGLGLLNAFDLSWPVRFALAVILLDGWMYLWHRANHAVPLLWRFHRMHHSDRRMDVTTATRFHLGEHLGASIARLALIPLLGLELIWLVAYDALLLAVTQFHHADISVGRWDRPLRWLIVTPGMHKVHHSDWRPETNSNYSSVLSLWDRLGRTFRMRSDLKTLVFGLPEFTHPSWQSLWGMVRTPLANPPPIASLAEQAPAEQAPAGKC